MKENKNLETITEFPSRHELDNQITYVTLCQTGDYCSKSGCINSHSTDIQAVS